MTRPKILVVARPVSLKKFAVSPVPTLKRPKLWNRLEPFLVPPVRLCVVPAWLMLVPRFPLGVIAVVTWAWQGSQFSNNRRITVNRKLLLR